MIEGQKKCLHALYNKWHAGDIADEAGGRQTAACPVNPGDRIQAGAGIDASHYRDGTG